MMMIQWIILLVFVVSVSDLRRKAGIALIHPRIIRFVKVSYLVPISLYGYVLTQVGNPRPADFVGVMLTLCGTILVVKAKRDLGDQHTWAGYGHPRPRIVRTGVYRWLAHPLYTGIILFIIGALCTITAHASALVITIVFVAVTYIIGFLAVVSSRETKHLAEHQRGADAAPASESKQ